MANAPAGGATVNEQVTDSVTQVSVESIGSTPASAMGNLFTAMSLSLGQAAHNNTGALQQGSITMQAATVQGVNSLTSIGSAVLGRAAEDIVEKDA